ncbi:DUF4041 domain-containing protein, partial [Photobacterium sp. BZF1]|uniref:DUF4041 domain-containing protein n=1 Tax=Photobacterium sp. BZF1 TaxID=1904457 RepID=UPI0016537593
EEAKVECETLTSETHQKVKVIENAAKEEADKVLKKANQEAEYLTTQAVQELDAAKNYAEIIKKKADDTLNMAEKEVAKRNEEAKMECETLTSETHQKVKAIENAAKEEADKVVKKANQEAEYLTAQAVQELYAAKNYAEETEKKALGITVSAEKDAALLIAKVKLEQQHTLDEIEALEKKKTDLDRKVRKLNSYVEHGDMIKTVTDYQYLLDGPISEAIKKKLDRNKQKQKDLIGSGKAFKVTAGILWNDSARQGKARQNRLAKFLVAAFNTEVDNVISNTTASNFSSGAKKIERWFDKVNKGGKDDYVLLSSKLLDLRLEEHRHSFEFKMKKSLEAEEQRYLRDAIREEEKVKKEIEKFVAAREKEEKSYQDDLNKAIRQINTANAAEVEKLNLHIQALREKLEIATSEKERA